MFAVVDGVAIGFGRERAMGDKTDGLTIFVELCDIEPATVVIAWPLTSCSSNDPLPTDTPIVPDVDA